MPDTLQTRLDRIYNNIIGYVKTIDPSNKILDSDKDPERMHSLVTAPEYNNIDRFAIDVSKQIVPSLTDSITNSDIGGLEEWGELLLGRFRGPSETIEEYRTAILDALMPTAKGGNNAHLLEWALQVSDVKRVYPYVGNGSVDAITIEDIEGRLDGAYVYVQSSLGDSTPSSTMLEAVKAKYLLLATISAIKINVVPIILRPYDFTYEIEPSKIGSTAPVMEAQNKVTEITIEILENTQPFIKYVDDIRRDRVITGQYLRQVNNIIKTPPYRYILNDMMIEKDGVEVNVDQLPKGNIPTIGSITFV